MMGIDGKSQKRHQNFFSYPVEDGMGRVVTLPYYITSKLFRLEIKILDMMCDVSFSFMTQAL